MKITMDFETRSEADLFKMGAWKYSLHPTTEVMCLGWSEGIYEDQWVMGDRLMPTYLFTLLADPKSYVESHNASFERYVWLNVCHRRMGWPAIPDHKWRCSMAKTSQCAVSRSLGDAGRAMRLDIVKDEMFGKSAMMKLTRPKKDGTWNMDPETWKTMLAYNVTDVRSEEALSEALPDLPPKEVAIYQMSERMNARGFAVDVEGAKKAILLATHHVNELVTEFSDLTGGIQPGQRAKFITWLNLNGTQVTDSQAATLDDVIAANGDPEVTRACEIVRAVGRSSRAKYQRMLDLVDTDHRVRGCFLYHGANTGRWAGRDLQPHNFPRGKIKNFEDAWELLLSVSPEIFPLLVDPLQFLSHALRGAIWAPEGRQLYCADYAQIEARVLFWLAGEVNGLEVFRDPTKDIYCDMASGIYHRVITKANALERQFGKQAILGLGFGMGFIKFLITCRLYDITFTNEQIAAIVPAGERNAVARWIWEEAWSRVKEMIPDVTRADLMQLVLMKHVVDVYRKKYEPVVTFWYALERAAKDAVANPGSICMANDKITYMVKGQFLTCGLPSGRLLYYPYPELKNGELSHMRVNDKNQWVRQKTYGGRLAENVTQAVARDVMAEAMLRCEATPPYQELVMTVHDEIVVETDEGAGDLEEFLHVVSIAPTWARGLPVKAEGWVGRRYRK